MKCFLILIPQMQMLDLDHGAELVLPAIENPDKSGINVSDNVGEYTYNGGDAGLRKLIG